MSQLDLGRTPLCDDVADRTDRSHARNTTWLTSQAESYWGQYDEVAKFNVQLNVFEKLWAAWYAYMQNDVLATGIMSFMMHEIVYFGRSLPWLTIDRIPYFNRYKIQNVCLRPRDRMSSSCCRRRCDDADERHGSIKSQRPRNSGTARSWCCSVTSPSSCPRYG